MFGQFKKNTLRRGLLLGLVVGTLGIGTVAFARPFGGGGFGMPGMGILRMVERLELTEQQEVQAVRLRREVREEMKGMRAQTHAEMGQVIDELAKPTPDARKIHGVVDNALARMGKLAHAVVDKALAFHATLSPEQKQTLAEDAKRFHERAQQRQNDNDERPRGPKGAGGKGRW